MLIEFSQIPTEHSSEITADMEFPDLGCDGTEIKTPNIGSTARNTMISPRLYTGSNTAGRQALIF